jgi:hypothetical protein
MCCEREIISFSEGGEISFFGQNIDPCCCLCPGLVPFVQSSQDALMFEAKTSAFIDIS